MRRQGQDGVVLIVALWTIILFSVIAAGLINLSQSERRIARSIVKASEDRALADAGITKVIAALITRNPDTAFLLDGTPKQVEFGGRKIEVSVQDETGKVDLNFASETTLSNLFVVLGVERQRSISLAAAIADWRDEDDLRRLNGAERDDYVSAGLLFLPRNGPFESVEELERVIGMNKETFEKARPYLTIFSRHAAINPQTASEVVLRAYELANTVGGSLGLSSTPSRARTDTLSDLPGRAFSIVAHVLESTSVTRSVVIRFTGNPNGSYLVQDWQ